MIFWAINSGVQTFSSLQASITPSKITKRHMDTSVQASNPPDIAQHPQRQNALTR